jgi:hypothetical protein
MRGDINSARDSKMLRPIALALTILVHAPVAEASYYIRNREDWLSLSSAQQTAWAVGFIEGAFGTFYPDDLYREFASRCLEEIQIDPQAIVSMIDADYRTEANWDKQPYLIAWTGIRSLCLARINKYRSERGFPPYEQ